jgi:hypothetical protein
MAVAAESNFILELTFRLEPHLQTHFQQYDCKLLPKFSDARIIESKLA